MENNSRLKTWIIQLGEKISEQVWFQQLKSKWDELDLQSRFYLKSAAIVSALLLAVALVITSIWKVHKLKNDLAERSNLLNLVQAANNEIKTLKDSSSGGLPTASPTTPLQNYFESVAQSLDLDKSNLEVSAEKPGENLDIAKESKFDINIKHANIKQIIRFVFSLENGSKPIKVRNLSIDTKNDPSGYMDASLAVSAFSMK